MDYIKNLRINLESKILKSSKVVIIPHLNADMDAAISAIGISLIATKLKKQAIIINDDPIYKSNHAVQNLIDTIGTRFKIVTQEEYLATKHNNDLYVLVDVNSSKLISMNEHLDKRNNIFIVDHHETDENTIKTKYSYINTEYSSVAEIITQLLSQFKVTYGTDIADYLLAAIYIDTQKLTAPNITESTFEMLSKLYRHGGNMTKVKNLLAEDFVANKKTRELVESAKIFKYSYALTLGDNTISYTTKQLAEAADFMLEYNVDAAYAVGLLEDGRIGISARSKEKFNVCNIMKELGGGGKKYAAATQLTNTNVEEVGRQLVKIISPPHIIK